MAYEVVSIRRYPVKSMGGEYLDVARLDGRGIVGDRWFAVTDSDGKFASGKNTRRFRRRDNVFDYRAETSAAGDIHVRRQDRAWAVGTPDLDAELSAAMGTAVTVAPEGPTPHQDAGSVSLIGTASLRWCADQWGIDADPRRLRVNIVFASDEPFIEDTWVDQTITLGTAALRVVEPIPRCRMIDLDQDGAAAEGRWLKPLTRHRNMHAAMYADVATPGRFAIGDTVVSPLSR